MATRRQSFDRQYCGSAMKGVGVVPHQRSTVRDLRRGNSAVVLWQLYFDGPASRQELSRLTGLSAGTVGNVVSDLIASGVVVTAGSMDSDGGRPHVLLRVNPGHRSVIGVDVGETCVRVELFDLAMSLRAKVSYELTDGHDVEFVVDRILAGIKAVCAEAGISERDVLGVGIGVSGVVEHGAEVLVHGQTFGWDAVPLERLLRAGTDLPLHIDNGAKNMGQAEMWFGAGRGSRHAVVVLIGSGVGASIITHGSTYRGSTSSAGEWGHTVVHVGGRRCRCGARGCLEAYVGAEAVLARYQEAKRGRRRRGVSEETAFAELLDAAGRGGVAAEVLDETAAYLGAGIANLVNLFNPERIIVGGWAGLLLGARLLPKITAAAAEHALDHPFAQATIELGRLGPDAVALGAATLPVEHFLTTGGAATPGNRDRAASRHDSA